MPTAAISNLQVGLLLFPDLDQLDFTGPFEVLSRMPDSTLHLLWKTVSPAEKMFIARSETCKRVAARLGV